MSKNKIRLINSNQNKMMGPSALFEGNADTWGPLPMVELFSVWWDAKHSP